MRCALSLCVLLIACGDDDGAADAALEDIVTANDVEIPGAGRELATVTHTRELRGVWIATVNNINWPSRPGLDAAAQRTELTNLFDVAVATGLNAVFFQVRPEADALYASDLEPWSRFLSGGQGDDPGYDPLTFAIDEAHARGLELHAWMNPYRAKSSTSSSAAPTHPSVILAEHTRTYGTFAWLDPGAEAVQDHTLAVIRDVLTRYDVDGLHLDDYFYPYPTRADFPDDTTYGAYTASGGELGRGDWRRDNVNTLIAAIADLVREVAPSVRFGISPFGIYRPGMPEGISGLDQYNTIFADPVRWMEEGWVDYIAPQLYWPSTRTAQAYAPLAAWWADLAHDGHRVFVGNFLSKLGTEAEWTVDEFRTQLELTRALSEEGMQGNIYFQIAPLVRNTESIADVFADEFYAEPASSPPIAAALGASLAIPTVSSTEGGVVVAHTDPLRSYGVYVEEGSDWRLDRLVPASAVDISLGSGRWAVSAIDRRGVESPGVVVSRP